jgi:hypothetical protein
VAKNAPDAVQDAALDYIDLSNIVHVCTGEPANYAAIAAISLASVAMVPNTDFTKAAGSVSGRKMTVAAKSGVSVATSGTATHIVLALTSDTTLRYVTTCTSQVLTAGNTVNIPAWDIEIQDPT